MNWIDYIILGILFLSTAAGLSRGLVRELLSLLFLIAAVFIAMKYSEALAVYFGHTEILGNVGKSLSIEGSQGTSPPASYVILCISFLVLFIGTLLLGAIINFFIGSIFQAGLLGFGNRLLGFVFGFCRGIIITVVTIFVLQFSSAVQESDFEQSKLLPYFKPLVIKLNTIISPKLDELKTKFQEKILNNNQ